MDRGPPGRRPSGLARAGRVTPLPGAVTTALVPLGLQVTSHWPQPSSSTVLLLLVGIPAWVFAIYTFSLWYRNTRRHRPALDAVPVPEDAPAAEEL